MTDIATIEATPDPEFEGLFTVTQAALDGFFAEYRADALRWRAVSAAFSTGKAITFGHNKDGVVLSVGLRRFFADSVDEAVEKMGERE